MYYNKGQKTERREADEQMTEMEVDFTVSSPEDLEPKSHGVCILLILFQNM